MNRITATEIRMVGAILDRMAMTVRSDSRTEYIWLDEPPATDNRWRFGAGTDNCPCRHCKEKYNRKNVKTKTFNEWLQSTSELLEDCAKRGQ